MSPAPAQSWQLFAHPLFLDQVDRLAAAVERAQAKDPGGWRQSANAKLLAVLCQLVFHTIPQDPARPEYRQGTTLGPGHKHWFRAKFGGGRFRLFFRYSTGARVIVFAWVNDETTLRTYGAKSDAYAVFHKMLQSGRPPDDWGQLLAEAQAEERRLRQFAASASGPP
ncbi:type II toxin-antitoxin system YhaV family toxin [Pseudorhodoferax sp.]|uniref:type II toxin-antitoxin system YhaV family toxin n=1 Tax=Pseudorhodoferax sp. TaxID=1993553 RepID=UPI0039E50019